MVGVGGQKYDRCTDHRYTEDELGTAEVELHFRNRSCTMRRAM